MMLLSGVPFMLIIMVERISYDHRQIANVFLNLIETKSLGCCSMGKLQILTS
jgi:hypothetical protein